MFNIGEIMHLVSDNKSVSLATNKPTIRIYDRIMGAGKTTELAANMVRWWNEYKYDQIVYLAPNLSEVGGIAKGENGEPDVEHSGRIREACPQLDFKNPKSNWKGGKADDARDLVRNGSNISATHQLFRNIMPEDLELVSQRKSLLVIDEALAVIERYSGVSDTGLSELISDKKIVPDDKGKLSWHGIKNVSDDYEYREIKELCDSGHLFLTKSNTLVIWEFPSEVLDAFDEVYISTYLFEGSLMHGWLKYNDYEFSYANQTEPERRQAMEVWDKDRVRGLINIVNVPRANNFEERELSQYWWNNSTTKQREKVKRAAESVVRRHLNGAGVNDMLVTCPKARWKQGANGAKGKGYSRAQWLASNTRATNDYADKTAVLYLLNKNIDTDIKRYIEHRGGHVDSDAYALGEMLQFLWRGCIRKGEPMTVYLPSKRMRRLLMDWLEIPLEDQF